MTDSIIYDLLIIGAGPAGLTASIYASCYHLRHIVVGSVLGGQLQYAPDILNYPGFSGVSGKELTNRLIEQVRLRGGEIIIDSVVRINQSTNQPINQSTNNQTNTRFEIETQSGRRYQARAIIVASGTERRKLNVPGEIEYTGKGVHYCATCEKFDYEGKICGVVGGANSALQSAVELAQAASKVYIIYRGTQLRGDAVWLDQVQKHPNIEVLYGTEVTEIVGDGEKVTGVKLLAGPAARAMPAGRQVSQASLQVPAFVPLSGTSAGKLRDTNAPFPSGNSRLDGEPHHGSPTLVPPAGDRILKLDKIFIEIGGVPGTALVIPLGVAMDPGGFIHVNERLETNVPGVFAAGDLVSSKLSIEQISSAVGLGARAAATAFAYIKHTKAPSVWGGSQIQR